MTSPATVGTTSLSESPEIEVVPLVPWDDFVKGFRWEPGEHVGLIGPTGSGKTHLATWLLPMRKYVIIFGTKSRDKTLDKFGNALGFKRIPKWENLSTKKNPRRIVWPAVNSKLDVPVQRAVFDDAINHVYAQGGWTLYIDELWYMVKMLRMDLDIKFILQQARSKDISLVIASQRPAWIPVEVYDQSTHLFFWRDPDITNLRRIGGIGVHDSRLVINAVRRLPKYHCLYMNTRTEKILITKPPKGGY